MSVSTARGSFEEAARSLFSDLSPENKETITCQGLSLNGKKEVWKLNTEQVSPGLFESKFAVGRTVGFDAYENVWQKGSYLRYDTAAVEQLGVISIQEVQYRYGQLFVVYVRQEFVLFVGKLWQKLNFDG